MISAEIARLGKLDPVVVDDVMDEFYAMATTRYAGVGRHGLRPGAAGGVARQGAGGADPGPARSVDERHPVQLPQPRRPPAAALLRAVRAPADDRAGAGAHPVGAGLVDPGRPAAGGADRGRAPDRGHGPHLAGRSSARWSRPCSASSPRVLQPDELSTVGGLQPLVDIINRADRTTERLILEALDARSPELAEEIRRRMFMFEDIVNLEDRAVQLVLRQVEPADLATALKGVPDDVRDKVTKQPLRARPGEPARGDRPARPGQGQDGRGGPGEDRLGDPLAGGLRPDRDPAWRRGR